MLNTWPPCIKCIKGMHSTHDYFKALGVSDMGIRTKKDYVLAALGKPDEIRSVAVRGDEERLVLDYGQYAFFYELDNDGQAGWLNHFEVYSPGIVFSNGIHVGSSREEVIEAYTGTTKVKESVLGEAYFDNVVTSETLGSVWTRYVRFEYDTDDRVTLIKYYPSL